MEIKNIYHGRGEIFDENYFYLSWFSFKQIQPRSKMISGAILLIMDNRTNNEKKIYTHIINE